MSMIIINGHWIDYDHDHDYGYHDQTDNNHDGHNEHGEYDPSYELCWTLCEIVRLTSKSIIEW